MAIDAAERLVLLTVERTAADVEADRDRHDALLWNLTVLGEAVAPLSVEMKAADPDVRWSDPIRVRDRIDRRHRQLGLALERPLAGVAGRASADQRIDEHRCLEHGHRPVGATAVDPALRRLRSSRMAGALDAAAHPALPMAAARASATSSAGVRSGRCG